MAPKARITITLRLTVELYEALAACAKAEAASFSRTALRAFEAYVEASGPASRPNPPIPEDYDDFEEEPQ